MKSPRVLGLPVRSAGIGLLGWAVFFGPGCRREASGDAVMAASTAAPSLRLREISPAWMARYPADPLADPREDEDAAPFIWPIEASFFEPFLVCGEEDGREAVKDPTIAPWNGNCRLIITLPTGEKRAGSGWLMGPRLVVTAGHCVHGGLGGQFFTSVEVIPAANGRKRPFGSQVSSDFRAPAAWQAGGIETHDYGAIILKEPFQADLTYRTPVIKSEAELLSVPSEVAAYPAAKFGKQWRDEETLRDCDAAFLHYDLDTTEGQSGGAAVRQGEVVGIHFDGRCPNKAIRISQSVLDDLNLWLEESNAQP